MRHPFCPNPVVVQPLYTGPLGVPSDPFAHQLCTQGYASSTAQSRIRLLADRSRWLQRQALTGMDRNDQRVADVLQARSRRCRPHRHDRSTCRRWLAQLRAHGVLPLPRAEARPRAGARIARALQHSRGAQRGWAPTTGPSSHDTVRRLLDQRCGPQALPLAALGPPDVSTFRLQPARCESPAHAQVSATARRSVCRFFCQRGVIANDGAKAVPTVPNWRLSPLPRGLQAEEVPCR
jgi:hypothetical protein